jgi:3-oxoacyl-[acyl-carrier protein] reductase
MDTGKAFRLDDRVAIVTGGGSGIGAASATVLAGAGARVVVADLDLDKAEQVAKDITSDGASAVARKVDVSDPADVQALVDWTVANLGGLNILHNNAGIIIRKQLTDITPEEFDRVLSVNLKSMLYGIQSAAKVMPPGSSVVNTLSSIIDYSTKGTGSYAASKKGGEAVTRTFAIELGPRNIRVNAIAPGWTETGMTHGNAITESGDFDREKFDQLAGRMSEISPLGRIAEPIDHAYAVLYLASDASQFVTGHVIRVNGGASMA